MTQKVYIVREWNMGGCSDVCGVFTAKDDADRCANARVDGYDAAKYGYTYTVEEYEVKE